MHEGPGQAVEGGQVVILVKAHEANGARQVQRRRPRFQFAAQLPIAHQHQVPGALPGAGAIGGEGVHEAGQVFLLDEPA